MPSLDEIQTTLARALVGRRVERLPHALRDEHEARARFSIHLRHYETSLIKALQDKFPATVRLLGARPFHAAARTFVHAHPPRSPCIAEYGREFPSFLASCPATAPSAYLSSLARLEWLVTRASISIAFSPSRWHDVASLGVARVLAARFELQPGTGYLAALHPVDSMLEQFLSERPFERLELAESVTRLEVSGARGRFRIRRLDAASYAFRGALQRGRSLREAASAALDLDPDFDAGRALRALTASGLVVHSDRREEASDANAHL